MSTTEVASKSHLDGRQGDGGNGLESSWSDQVVLSSAGLLSGGIERTRVNTEAFLDVADSLVLGAFDLLDEWSSLTEQLVPQLLPMLTAKPAQLARQAYTTASRAVRESVSRS